MNHIEAMKLALDHSEPSILSPGWTLVRNEDIAALRSALSEQPAQQEPVKVKTCDTCQFGERCNQWSCKNHSLWKPVQPARRKPLTDAQINAFFEGMEPNNGFWLSFARAIEAAHQIGVEK